MKRFIVAVLLVFLCVSPVLGAGQSVSGVTAQTIIDRVKANLNTTSSAFWSDLDLLRWMDEGVKEIQALTHAIQDTTTIELSGNTMEYSWTGVSNYMTVENVTYRSGASNAWSFKGLKKATVAIIGNTSDKGPPEYWYEWDNKIGVWPKPTDAYSGNSIFVYYAPIPDGVESGTSPIELPAMYDGPLIWYVTCFAKKREKRFEEAAVYMGRYNQILGRFRLDLVEGRSPQVQ